MAFADGTQGTASTTIPDTDPPSVPTNLTATAVSTSQIDLSWNASTDNVGVTGYRIYRGGTHIATSSGSSYSDTGLSAATSYTYAVSAYDAAGKVSNQSTSASATTDGSAGRVIHIYPGTNVFGPAVPSLAAGDTLIVHEGTYLETNRMSIQVEGTSGSPIVIRGADGESKPVITRPGEASVQNTINIEGSATYVTIKGLEITGNGGDGVKIMGNVSYLTLEDLYIHDVDVGIGTHTSIHHITIRKNHITRTGINGGTGEGMYIGCHGGDCSIQDSVIENNWIHDNLPGTSQGDGIEIKYGSYNNTIRDNVIYNMSYPGIFVYGHGGTGGVNTVEGNVIWNCLEGIYAVSDAVVRNNFVFNSGTGLSLYPHAAVPVMENVTAVNNTLYDNDDGVYIRWGSASNMGLANNAIYSAGKRAVNSDSVISPASAAVRSNYVEGGMGGEAVDDVKFLDGGPYSSAFVNASGNDFWPKSNSPLRNNANASYSPVYDFNGTSRTSPFDVGAYETQGLAENPGWKITEGFKELP